MGDLVNLNKFRKAKQRRAEEVQAGINREKFGRTKAETNRDRQTRERGDKQLDGAKVESEGTPAPDGNKPNR